MLCQGPLADAFKEKIIIVQIYVPLPLFINYIWVIACILFWTSFIAWIFSYLGANVSVTGRKYCLQINIYSNTPSYPHYHLNICCGLSNTTFVYECETPTGINKAKIASDMCTCTQGEMGNCAFLSATQQYHSQVPWTFLGTLHLGLATCCSLIDVCVLTLLFWMFKCMKKPSSVLFGPG